MFCWTSSSVGSEPLDGVANMSKSDILRGIITEKLSTAAREILAVVERTIADYEEEVAGFRQEIDRQRRLLELLQPRVKLERRELTPELHSCDVLMEASLEENEHHTQQSDILCPDVKDTVNSGLPVYDNVDEEGVEMPFVQPDTSSTQHEEHLKEPDHQIPMHISIWNSASKPELQECTTCCRRLFHCPLCPTFSPTVRAVIEEHINGHIKNALPFKDKMICRCRLPCRTTGHFHCPVCNMTIIRRGDMARHLLSCQHSSIASQPPLSGLLPTALSKEPRRPLIVFSPASKPFSESSVEHAYALPSVLNKVHENEMPSLWS